jgi:hypothetical protein
MDDPWKEPPKKLTTKLRNGKYAGRTIEEVIELDPKYLNYCIENYDNFELDNEAYTKLVEELKWI